jgi:hypothetical protein
VGVMVMLASKAVKRLTGGMKLRFIPKTKKKRIILGIALLLIAGAVAFLLTRGEEVVEEITQPDKKYYSQLTGLEVDEETSELPILGVMIENSEEARPQTGLDSAGIVFETTTEAGITRYLALYQENKPEEVGPVRSVRPAFVDWGMGFDVSFAHVGGSAEALEKIDRQGAKTMNQFFNDGPYYRRTDRESPHNMYAKMNELVALQIEKNHKTAKFAEIPRSDDAPSAQPTASTISLQFSHPIFGVTFTYDAATNTYARSLAGAPHIDAGTNKQITVKNVIVIKMSGEVTAVGSGEAQLFKDGTVQKVRWQLTDYRSRIKLIDAAGNEVSLNRGDTWVSVLPGSGTVIVK